MREYDAIVMTGGAFRGWVGYFIEKSLNMDNVSVRLFSSDGDVYNTDVPFEHVKCVEPK